MKPLVLALPAYYAKTTWSGFSVKDLLINDVAPTIALDKAYLEFKDKYGTVGFAYSSEPDTHCKGIITIDDSNLWDMTVTSTILPLTPGIWFWNMLGTDIEGTVMPLFVGRLLVKSL